MQHKKPERSILIEEYINRYKDVNKGASPTVRDIAQACDISPATVSRYMNYMKNNGVITFSGHRNITTKQDEIEDDFCRVPVLGKVSCGIPKFAEENIEEYVKLPTKLFGKGNFFCLRANGDSMINVGINDGDIVLIKQQNVADYNQIIVALVDDEATLKRFRPSGDKIILHPENDKYDDIEVESCEIQGVAVKVIKELS